MKLIVVRKNEFVENIDDIDQAYFYKDKVIMNRPPLNISVLPLGENIASINCQDTNMEVVKELEKQLKERENMHLLDEREFQHYCSFKHIKPEIRGCLDRERNYIKEIALLKKEVELAVSQIVKLSDRIGDCETSCPAYETCKGLTDEDCRNVVIESLEIKAKEMMESE